MGYGAYMKINNKSSKTVTTNVTDQDCMYQDGNEGSHLEYFDNLRVDAFTESENKYIEAKASGGCFFNDSKFTLKVKGLNSSASEIKFVDSSKNWRCTNNTGNINVNINNSGDQATIVITLSDDAFAELVTMTGVVNEPSNDKPAE